MPPLPARLTRLSRDAQRQLGALDRSGDDLRLPPCNRMIGMMGCRGRRAGVVDAPVVTLPAAGRHCCALGLCSTNCCGSSCHVRRRSGSLVVSVPRPRGARAQARFTASAWPPCSGSWIGPMPSTCSRGARWVSRPEQQASEGRPALSAAPDSSASSCCPSWDMVGRS